MIPPDAPTSSPAIWSCSHCAYAERQNRPDWEKRRRDHEAQCPSNPAGHGHPLHGHIPGSPVVLPEQAARSLSRLLVKLRFQEGTFTVQEQCDYRAALEWVLGHLAALRPVVLPEPTPLELIDRLENYYAFECEAGPLRLCVEWEQLKAALRSTSVSASTPRSEEGSDL